MEIPFTALSSDTLEAIIEEFITREGTDYGEREYSLAAKVEQVKQQLQRGEVIINYDAETQTCHLAPRR
jgi:uncharacterized protein YheU (UPF0270 family)